MKEPTPSESLDYFCDYIEEKKDILFQKITENSIMGEWNLEGEALGDLVGWLGEGKNREELKKFFSASVSRSPKWKVGNFLSSSPLHPSSSSPLHPSSSSSSSSSSTSSLKSSSSRSSPFLVES